MENKEIYYSELQHFEIINEFDGTKYNNIGDNDILINENGEFSALVIFKPRVKFSLFKSMDILSIPWHNVRKIGKETLILDYDFDEEKESR